MSNVRNFEQITFENEPSENTPLSASNLNVLQQRIQTLFNDTPNGNSKVVTNADTESIQGIYIISSGATNFPFDTRASAYNRGFLIVLSRDGMNEVKQIAISPRASDSIWIRSAVSSGSGLTSISSWKRLYEPATILYEDLTTENGTINDVTLSDSLENYDYVEIYYARRDGNMAPKRSVKIDNPNGKYSTLQLIMPIDSAGILQITGAYIYLNRNKIERQYSCMVGIDSNGIAEYSDHPAQGPLRIYRVIGYKKIGGEV